MSSLAGKVELMSHQRSARAGAEPGLNPPDRWDRLAARSFSSSLALINTTECASPVPYLRIITETYHRDVPLECMSLFHISSVNNQTANAAMDVHVLVRMI
jgi:hypothetical protein